MKPRGKGTEYNFQNCEVREKEEILSISPVWKTTTKGKEEAG